VDETQKREGTGLVVLVVGAVSLLLQAGPVAGQVGTWATQSECIFDGSGILYAQSMDQITIQTPNPKGSLFLKIDL
jgi:hypothetical protein